MSYFEKDTVFVRHRHLANRHRNGILGPQLTMEAVLLAYNATTHAPQTGRHKPQKQDSIDTYSALYREYRKPVREDLRLSPGCSRDQQRHQSS